MSLLRLKVNNFRNLHSLSLECESNFNLIFGANGSGKTSILESIYYLSRGRSFRSHTSNRIISYGAENFSIFGAVATHEGLTVPVGIEKTLNGKTRIKLGNDELTSSAELAQTLPLLMINPDSYSLLDGGPKMRRQFLDWGVFHVEPQFFSIWQRFHRALKQRNAALAQEVSAKEVKVWDAELVSHGLELTKLREHYIQQLVPVVEEILSQLIDLEGLVITFQRGWDPQSDLQQELDNAFVRDKHLGFTSVGPQKANLDIRINKLPVHDVLSRGEQKLLVFSMLLAQGIQLRRCSEKKCIYLLDDIAAELDTQRWQRIKAVLVELQAQVFITATDISFFSELRDSVPSKLFHVEHGTARTPL